MRRLTCSPALSGAVFVALALLGAAAYAQHTYLDPRPVNAPHQKPAFPGQYHAPGLENPWELAFLPNGKMLVTEQLQPAIARGGSDGERRVAHMETRMPACFDVAGRAAEAADQEVAQPRVCGREISGRIHGTEDVVPDPVDVCTRAPPPRTRPASWCLDEDPTISSG